MDTKLFKFVDKPLLLVLFIILALGLIVLTSATMGIAGDPYSYVKRQFIAILLGLGAAFFIMRYDYTQLGRFGVVLYILSIMLLIAVLFLGSEVKGSTRALEIGPLPAFQPSELTKIFLIVAFADFLNKRRGALDTLGQILPGIIFMGIPFALILIQPDLGTALVYIAIAVIMLYAAGANPRILLALILIGIGFIAFTLFLHFRYDMWIPLDSYQLNRLTAFIDPYNDGFGGRGPGWNTIQSLIAVGSGGLAGKGLFNGTQVQLQFLPEHHTDFIFAVIAEELGFIGAAFLIVLFAVFLLRSVYIAYHAKDMFGTLVVIGVCAMWLFHIFENIGMSIGLMPITGLPLPFISYGGSAMVSNLIAVGLILSIGIRGRKIIF